MIKTVYKINTLVLSLSAMFAFLLLSCSFVQRSNSQPTSTANPPTSTTQPPTINPTSSPFPFRLYGETRIDIYYCTMDDLPQKMDVYFPQSGGPWPALVYVHGGSWRGGDKSEAMAFAERMRAQGYLVVSVNYRMPPAGRFPAMIEDVKCTIRFLRANSTEYNLDPERIAAAGASAGGHLVALLGTTDESAGWDKGEYLDQSSRVQAVISLAGVMDLTRNFPDMDVESMREVGFSEDNVVQASPITYVTPDDPPFLLIHGDQDMTVPLEQSQLMYERLQETGVPAQLIVVHGAEHAPIDPNGSTTPTVDEIYQTISDFLMTSLQ